VPESVDKIAAGSEPKELPVKSLIASNTPPSQSADTPDRSTAKNVSPTRIADLPPDEPLVVPTDPKEVEIERIQPLTLKEALEIANRKSPPIIQARLAVEKAKAQLDGAVAAGYPTVGAQLGYTYIDSALLRVFNQVPLTPGELRVNTFSGTTTSTFNSTITQPVNGSLFVNYNLYTSGQVQANIGAAENSLRAAESDLNTVTETTRLSVATAYYAAQNADGTVSVRQQQVKNAERGLKDTQAKLETGVGTKFAVLQARVQLANANQSLVSAQADQATSHSELARQLSFPFNVGLSTTDEIKPAEDWKLSQTETILLALKNRSELDTQRSLRKAARDRAKAALAALGPQVNIYGSFDQADNLSLTGGVALGYRAGFNITWTLYDAGAASAQARQFDAERALAESRFTQFADQARLDVVRAYNTLKASREQIPAATLALEEAREALDLSQARLNSGITTELELIQNEDAFTQAEVNRLNAVINFNQAIVQLKRAISGL
ncbi:MAG: TolC family protein, partial [Gloeobacterales cyanobacterium]